jgi:signal transduction histidine kinase
VRRWLSLYALSVTSIVILAFLVPLAVLIRDLAADRAMSAAEREAQTVARFAATIDADIDSVATLAATLAAAPNTSVRLSDGSVIGAVLPSGVDVTAAIERGQAYQQSLDDGRAVVVPVLRGNADPWVVVIAVSSAALSQNVGSAWAVLALLGGGLIALAFVVADRMGRAVVTPINDLVEATHRLGRGELTVAVDPSGPSELAEVGSAFNALTGRVSSLMDRERETAADLSHRLRTPLTALRLDIEALGQTTDVARLQRDVDGLERVVSHVISEARRSVRDGAGTSADLALAVENRVAYWGSLAEDQDREWALDVKPARYGVAGNAADLEAMLDAILGNVFAHTPVGTGYRIQLSASPGGIAELIIVDDGPGIPDPSLLERGVSGGESTGLGADIVRRTAEIAGGAAHWESGEGSGTLVRVLMPLVGAVR